MSQHTEKFCPVCDRAITGADINLTEGVALCSGCGELSRLSDLNYSGEPLGELLTNPPKGIQVDSDGNQLVMTVSLRSFLGFLGSLAACLFWNGIVSLFLSLAVAAVFYNVTGAVPEWLPVPGLEDGKPVMNDEVMGVGATIGICVFLIPFVAIGISMIIHTLLKAFGTTRIVLDANESSVSTGISFLRLRKTFDLRSVKEVEYTKSKWNQQDQDQYLLQLNAPKPVKFGLLLKPKQQEWVYAFLQSLIVHKRMPSTVRALHWM